MTNNKPHVRSYFSFKVYQEVIREHNNRLNDLYNPKAINIYYLFFKKLKYNYCRFYPLCIVSNDKQIICKDNNWINCNMYKELIKLSE